MGIFFLPSFVLYFPTRKSTGTPTRDLGFGREVAFCFGSALLGNFALRKNTTKTERRYTHVFLCVGVSLNSPSALLYCANSCGVFVAAHARAFAPAPRPMPHAPPLQAFSVPSADISPLDFPLSSNPAASCSIAAPTPSPFRYSLISFVLRCVFALAALHAFARVSNDDTIAHTSHLTAPLHSTHAGSLPHRLRNTPPRLPIHPSQVWNRLPPVSLCCCCCCCCCCWLRHVAVESGDTTRAVPLSWRNPPPDHLDCARRDSCAAEALRSRRRPAGVQCRSDGSKLVVGLRRRAAARAPTRASASPCRRRRAGAPTRLGSASRSTRGAAHRSRRVGAARPRNS